MKTCIFCNEKAGSREHIIAQWLIDAMQAGEELVTVAYLDETGVHERKAHNLQNYVTRHICTVCNNGWMSKLEQAGKEALSPLVLPEWPKFHAEIFKQAARDRENVAKWALKTAIMMNENSELDSILDEELRRELYNGNIVSRVFVELAYIEQASVGKRLTKGFLMKNGAERPRWCARRDGKAFHCSFQLRHLGVRIFRCVGAEPKHFITNNRRPLPFYPITENPDAVDYRFHDFKEFSESLYLVSNLGMEWELR